MNFPVWGWAGALRVSYQSRFKSGRGRNWRTQDTEQRWKVITFSGGEGDLWDQPSVGQPNQIGQPNRFIAIGWGHGAWPLPWPLASHLSSSHQNGLIRTRRDFIICQEYEHICYILLYKENKKFCLYDDIWYIIPCTKHIEKSLHPG